MNSTVVNYLDFFHQSRLRSLQSVDEMIDQIVQNFANANILDNTYIFYTSDNGFHLVQHRLSPGKGCGYEEDLNIPLIIRGPGVDRGVISRAVTSHTDLAPTIMKIASGQAGLRPDFDGTPVPFTQSDRRSTEHVNVEFWGRYLTEGKYDWHITPNNTYKSLRLIGNGYNFYYSVWCTNEKELYEMNVRPSSRPRATSSSKLIYAPCRATLPKYRTSFSTHYSSFTSCRSTWPVPSFHVPFYSTVSTPSSSSSNPAKVDHAQIPGKQFIRMEMSTRSLMLWMSDLMGFMLRNRGFSIGVVRWGI